MLDTKSKKRLTPLERQFLSDFAYLTQKWNAERLGALFGVRKQSVQKLVVKRREVLKEKGVRKVK